MRYACRSSSDDIDEDGWLCLSALVCTLRVIVPRLLPYCCRIVIYNIVGRLTAVEHTHPGQYVPGQWALDIILFSVGGLLCVARAW